ncbi:hypothetical protein M422DRAFT_148352, partial [Sphaerobolus stellatus SS14]
LMNEEMDIICGVYYVYTGSGLQGENQSWWPKQNIWEGGGLNIGYWSNDCEVWYQNRLADIKAGKAKLKTAAEWR